MTFHEIMLSIRFLLFDQLNLLKFLVLVDHVNVNKNNWINIYVHDQKVTNSTVRQ